MSDKKKPAAAKSDDKPFVIEFILIVLRNISQVVLQNNALSGAIILGGIFYHSIDFGLAAVLGSLVSTITAYYFKSDVGAIRAGLMGFNGVLTGIAIVFYCETAFEVMDIPVWLVAVYISFGAAFSTVFTAAIGAITSQWDVPPLTAPFVLASWLFVAGTHFAPVLQPGHNLVHASAASAKTPAAKDPATSDQAGAVDPDASGGESTDSDPNDPETAGPLAADPDAATRFTLSNWLQGIGKGMGEVFFQDDALSGYIIFAGICVNSRISTIMALIGSLISILIAESLHLRESDINMGFYSYSTILTAIALGGLFFALNMRGFVFTLLAIVLTTWLYPALHEVCDFVHLPAYTTPFILATWLMLFSKNSFDGVVAIPLAEATKPEDHFRFIKRAST